MQYINTESGWFDRDCLVIDFETTGKDPATAEVLQVSIIDGWGLTLMNTYCKPERVTEWREAEAIHGIGPETVQGRPTFRELLPQVQKLLDRVPFLIAYNAAYELGILRRYGATIAKPFVDPMRMFAPVYGEWNSYHGNYRWQKLTTAAGYYGYTFDAHDALADVKATLHVFESMLADGVSPEMIAC